MKTVCYFVVDHWVSIHGGQRMELSNLVYFLISRLGASRKGAAQEQEQLGYKHPWTSTEIGGCWAIVYGPVSPVHQPDELDEVA